MEMSLLEGDYCQYGTLIRFPAADLIQTLLTIIAPLG